MAVSEALEKKMKPRVSRTQVRGRIIFIELRWTSIERRQVGVV